MRAVSLPWQGYLIDWESHQTSDFIYSYLRDHGVVHFNYIICTHAHEDHTGGLAGVLNFAAVGTA